MATAASRACSRGLDVRRADHLSLEQGALPDLGGGRGLQLRQRRLQFGAGRAHGQLLRDRIERRQSVAPPHGIADIHVPVHDAAEQAEAEPGLELRLDDAGEGLAPAGLRLDHDREHRAHRRRSGRLLVAASGERERDGEQG